MTAWHQDLLAGEPCVACAHPPCRAARAQRQLIRGGHRREFRHEHEQAAAVQARQPMLLVWYGEYTQSYWVATSSWMSSADTVDDLLVTIWRNARSPFPETGPYGQYPRPPSWPAVTS